ncbi:hypothetical protein MTO96_017673 [Rhipicephalus appendiculatus]
MGKAPRDPSTKNRRHISGPSGVSDHWHNGASLRWHHDHQTFLPAEQQISGTPTSLRGPKHGPLRFERSTATDCQYLGGSRTLDKRRATTFSKFSEPEVGAPAEKRLAARAEARR